MLLSQQTNVMFTSIYTICHLSLCQTTLCHFCVPPLPSKSYVTIYHNFIHLFHYVFSAYAFYHKNKQKMFYGRKLTNGCILYPSLVRYSQIQKSVPFIATSFPISYTYSHRHRVGKVLAFVKEDSVRHNSAQVQSRQLVQ